MELRSPHTVEKYQSNKIWFECHLVLSTTTESQILKLHDMHVEVSRDRLLAARRLRKALDEKEATEEAKGQELAKLRQGYDNT